MLLSGVFLNSLVTLGVQKDSKCIENVAFIKIKKSLDKLNTLD